MLSHLLCALSDLSVCILPHSLVPLCACLKACARSAAQATYPRARIAYYDMCSHAAMYVSAYCYICVLILLYVSSDCHMCPQATYPRGASLSHETISLIDSEVADLVKLAYGRAKQILVDNRQSLTSLTAMLLEKETVTGEELQRPHIPLLMCSRQTATHVSAYCYECVSSYCV